MTSEIIYGHKNYSEYFYDILTHSDSKLPDRKEMWKKSVYFNGNSAFPEKNESNFTETEVFNSTATADSECLFTYAYSDVDIDFMLTEETVKEEVFLIGSDTGRQLCCVRPPLFLEDRKELRMYYSPAVFTDNDGKIGDSSVTVQLSFDESIIGETYMSGEQAKVRQQNEAAMELEKKAKADADEEMKKNMEEFEENNESAYEN